MKNINVTKISILENGDSVTSNGVSLSLFREMRGKGCDIIGLTDRKQLYIRKPLKNSKELGKFAKIPLGKMQFHSGKMQFHSGKMEEIAGFSIFDGDMFNVFAETKNGKLVTYLEIIRRDIYRKDVCDIMIKEA